MGIEDEIKQELDWTLRGLDYSLPLKPDFDLDIKWVCKNGDSWRTFCNDFPRTVYLEVRDMLYSFGAMHYYSSLRLHSPSIINQNGEVLCLGGYGENQPSYLGGLRIDVARKLKKVEKDLSGEVLCKVGEFTTRFNTPKEALDQAIEYYKIIFGNKNGWKLEIDCDYEEAVKDL